MKDRIRLRHRTTRLRPSIRNSANLVNTYRRDPRGSDGPDPLKTRPERRVGRFPPSAFRTVNSAPLHPSRGPVQAEIRRIPIDRGRVPQPAPRCKPRLGEPLWSVRKDGVTGTLSGRISASTASRRRSCATANTDRPSFSAQGAGGSGGPDGENPKWVKARRLDWVERAWLGPHPSPKRRRLPRAERRTFDKCFDYPTLRGGDS